MPRKRQALGRLQDINATRPPLGHVDAMVRSGVHALAGRLFRGDIDHAPWPLQPAEAEIEQNTMADAAGFRLPEAKPILHYAERLDVVAWRIERVGL